MCPWPLQAAKWEREIEARNRPLHDEELDALMPTEGYRILEPPAGYTERTPSRKALGTPTPYGTPGGYLMPEEARGQQFDVPQEIEGLPELKPEDHMFFGKLMKDVSPLSSPSVHEYGYSLNRTSEDQRNEVAYSITALRSRVITRELSQHCCTSRGLLCFVFYLTQLRELFSNCHQNISAKQP